MKITNKLKVVAGKIGHLRKGFTDIIQDNNGKATGDAKDMIGLVFIMGILLPIALDLFFNTSQTNWPNSLVTLYNNIPTIGLAGIALLLLEKTT